MIAAPIQPAPALPSGPARPAQPLSGGKDFADTWLAQGKVEEAPSLDAGLPAIEAVLELPAGEAEATATATATQAAPAAEPMPAGRPAAQLAVFMPHDRPVAMQDGAVAPASDAERIDTWSGPKAGMQTDAAAPLPQRPAEDLSAATVAEHHLMAAADHRPGAAPDDHMPAARQHGMGDALSSPAPPIPTATPPQSTSDTPAAWRGSSPATAPRHRLDSLLPPTPQAAPITVSNVAPISGLAPALHELPGGVTPTAAPAAGNTVPEAGNVLPHWSAPAPDSGGLRLTPSPPQPPPAAQIAEALVQTRNGQIDVLLQPEELGRVRLILIPDGDSTRVQLTADRPETLDLLRRHSHELAAELRQAGMAGTSFSFAGDDRAGQRAGADQPQDTPNTALPDTEAGIIQRIRLAGTGLDLRL